MRAAHWIKANHQERMPARMVTFDTEARSEYDGRTETQSWRVGCGIRFRTDLKSGDRAEAKVFQDPESFWEWVAEYTHEGCRTVVWAHNLGYDVRISRMFDVLPKLGFRLEWCNLDRNISSATWRSDHGTIVLADTWTWVPLPLEVIAPQVGLVKYKMPPGQADNKEWARYCMRDCEILYNVVTDLMSFVKSRGLGNWQPTGAGMAYATWRHKFLSHKVLVHDNADALAAERIAMHTGRAEAWRHGKLYGGKWTEVDFKDAYLTIASDTELPRKLHMRHASISVEQFRRLRDNFAVLARVTISTSIPVVPAKINGRHVWPVGTFETWLWDNELGMALQYGAQVKIHEAYTYCRAPILAEWAKWVLEYLRGDRPDVSSVVRTHLKHCGRALIGRIALRVPAWELWGDNIEGTTGITNIVLVDEKRVTRMLSVGNDCLIETDRTEGKDSLPMITGYIMAEARCRLFGVMNVAGTENLAHVDTDSVLCDSTGLSRIRQYYGDRFTSVLAVKGTYTRLEIFGPRAYFRDRERVVAGIPKRAAESKPGVYADQRWSSLAADLAGGQTSSVTLTDATWRLRTSDPRRRDANGGRGMTCAYDAAALSSLNKSSPESASVGA
jgi:hypothetical protein